MSEGRLEWEVTDTGFISRPETGIYSIEENNGRFNAKVVAPDANYFIGTFRSVEAAAATCYASHLFTLERSSQLENVPTE